MGYQPQRVVITGSGVTSSLGNDWSTVKQSLQAKKSAICFMDDWQQYTDMKTRLAAPVKNFTLPDNYTKKKKRSMGRVAQMSVLATEKALKEAKC